MQKFVLRAALMGASLVIFIACSGAKKNLEKLNGHQLWMTKPDGSKMCGFAKGISPKDELEGLTKSGLHVLQARSGNDGLMHAMVCGGPTGRTIEIEVFEAELEKAKGLGYRKIDIQHLSH